MFGIIAFLIFAGCVAPPPTLPPVGLPSPVVQKNCTTIEKDVPVPKYDCTNYTVTTNVCDERPMNYSILQLSKITICSTDGACSGMPISNCDECSTALTRCALTIKSNEDSFVGAMTVSANFTLPSGAFGHPSQVKTLDPGDNATFNFNQFYNPGHPITSADCNIYVVGKPTVQDCKTLTRIESDCKQKTVIEKVPVEICT